MTRTPTEAEIAEALAAFEGDAFNPDNSEVSVRDAAPLRAVAAAVAARAAADEAIDDAVAGAVAAGFNWGQIGTMLGVTRQAARQRYLHLDRAAKRRIAWDTRKDASAKAKQKATDRAVTGIAAKKAPKGSSGRRR